VEKPVPVRRARIIQDLRATLERLIPPVELDELLYRIMYGMPFSIQLEVAVIPCKRYLPIYEFHHPGESLPARLLADPIAWHAAHGEEIPGLVVNRDLADPRFDFGLHALLFGCHYPEHPAVVSSQFCLTIRNAISARAENAWAADEPDVAQKERHSPGGRYALFDSVLYAPIIRREWEAVLAVLELHAANQPDEVDLVAMEDGLARWRRNHHLYLGPEDFT
jgi:hypothetical protein